MSQEVGPISPFFIVDNLKKAVAFYEYRFGFSVRFATPEDEPFFAIVGRGGSQLFLKRMSDDVHPQPNHTRHDWAPWDAFVSVDDPDGLSPEATAKVIVEAPQIELVANASHPVAFGDLLSQYLGQIVSMFNAHLHVGETAAGVLPVTPAPPIAQVPPPDPGLLSTTVAAGRLEETVNTLLDTLSGLRADSLRDFKELTTVMRSSERDPSMRLAIARKWLPMTRAQDRT